MGLKQFFCNHKWKVVRTERVDYDNVVAQKLSYAHKLVVIQLCEKCGKIKKTELKY